MPRPPVHAKRIADDLRQRILSGELRRGMPLPGRREMAESYGVAVLTLQRALAPLLADGTLRAESTRGTYVADTPTGGRRRAQANIAIIAQSEIDPNKGGGDEIWSAWAVRACEAVLSAAGSSTRFYNVMHHTRRWWTDPLAALQAAAAEGADAIIAINLTEAPGWAEAVGAFRQQWPGPLVYACGDTLPPGVSTVSHDQEASGAAAATHCLATGYRRVVAMRPYAASWLEHRLVGVRRAAGRKVQILDAAGGRPVHEFWARPAPEQVRFLADMVRGILAEPGPLAIIAPSDGVVRDLLPTLDLAGIQPGAGIGLIGFDDLPVARDEGLSTMAPPVEELGAAAGRLCLLSLRDGAEVRQVRVPSRLIARASTFLQAQRRRG